MGNSSKKSEKTHKQHNHLRLRNAKQHVIKNKSNIKAHFSVGSKQQLSEWQKRLKKSPAATANHAFIPNDIKSKSGMCGTASSVQAYYPGFWYLLSDEIKNRKTANKNVDESQIWKILYSLSETATEYHKTNIKTGDIRPSNILLNDEGDSRLITVDSWPDQEINYIKTLKNGEKTYLAPEQVKDVDIGRNKQNTNIEDGQAFSIGLTCLDCALRESSYQLYPQKGVFDQKLLQQKQNRFKNDPKFSPQLKAAILSLTDANPSNRSVPGEVYTWLKGNQVQIFNNYPFRPSSNVPSCVSMFLNKNRPQSSYNNNFNNEQSRFGDRLVPEYQTRYIPSNTQNQSSLPGNNNQYSITQGVSRSFYTTDPLHRETSNVQGYRQDPPVRIPEANSNFYPQYPKSNTTNTRNVFLDKPPATIRYRYLPNQTATNNYPSRPSYTLRDVYTSPDIGSRFNEGHRQHSNSYIPKSQQKQIRKPTYDFGNAINTPSSKYNVPNNYQQYKPLNSQNNNYNSNNRFTAKNTSNNQEQKDYNHTKVKTVAINRGSKQQFITAEVQQDYPERTKISNWKIDQEGGNVPILASKNDGNSNKVGTTAPEVEQDQPQRPKMAYWNSSAPNSTPKINRNYQQAGNSNIHTIHQASEEDSRLRSISRQTPSRSNIQPIQSVYESEEQNYKISFFNNTRVPNASSGRGGQEDDRMRANAGRRPVASGYQPSPVLQANSDDHQTRHAIVTKKKQHHDKEDEEYIQQKMNAQTTAVYPTH